MMTEEEILEELRTIRTLLAIDKEQDLQQLTNDLSEIQRAILRELSFSEWRSISTADVAEETGSGTSTVGRHRTELEDRNLINSRGEARGAEYQKSGLLRAAEQTGVLEE